MLNIQFGTFLVLVSNVCGMLFFFFLFVCLVGVLGEFSVCFKCTESVCCLQMQLFKSTFSISCTDDCIQDG